MHKLSLKIDITNMCNLNCEYCYVDKKTPLHLDIDLINKVIDNIRHMKNFFVKHVTFFGGEPSLLHNSINQIIHDNPDFTYSIVSNGYRLFEYDDDKFYTKFNTATFTLAGTELSYNRLRCCRNLSKKIDQVIRLKYKNPKLRIVVNMDINGLLLHDIDEFIDNCHKLKDGLINIHYYSIRGDNYFKDPAEMFDFLQKIPSDILRDMLMVHNYYKTDSPYLCGFSDQLTLKSNGMIASCTDYKEFGDATDLDNYLKIYNEIRLNHKKYWVGCSNCVVPVGMCQVSCPSFISKCYENNQKHILESCCTFEKVKEYMRRVILGKEVINGS